MAEAPYLIGIDYGTGGVRVGIFDREGAPTIFRAVPFETQYPRPGRAEQDPNEWWSCLGKAMQTTMRESDISPEEIAGISLGATSATVLAIDSQGRPMRPGIMWMDVRAADQARRSAQHAGGPVRGGEPESLGAATARLGIR